MTNIADTPLPQLLVQANKLGTGFRLYGRAVQVVGASRMAPDLYSALKVRCAEIWDHLGGTTLNEPPLELLATLGVEIVIPKTVAEAQTALVEIEADSSRNTPEELRDRPGLVGFDIETAALPGTEQRPAVALKRDGYPKTNQPAPNSDAGLDPHRSRVRLAQLYGGGRRCLVLDTDRMPLEVLATVLQRRTAVIHNAGFELRHLATLGIDIPHFEDTMQAAGLLLGVQHRGLDDAVSSYLAIELPKGLQRSDWSSPYLSAGQYAYAAIDAIVTFLLWLKLRIELIDKGRGGAYLLQRNVTPAVVRMTDRGVLLDREVHAEQIAAWSAKRSAAEKEFVTTTQQQPPAKPSEVRAYLQKVLPQALLDLWPRLKDGGLTTRAAQLRRVVHLPAIRSLLAITSMEKLLSAFGDELVDKISTTTNRLHPSYNIAATKAGRFSSNHPNVQQIPKHRAPEFRRCIIAAPDKVLVIGDFNMMELRAAAAVSGDPMMTADFANGVDLHAQQAATMLGIDYNDVDATARDHAKPVNFSMIYGAGAAGLVATAWNNYGIDLSLVEAEAARNAFLTRYATYATWMRINHAQVTQRGIIEIGQLGRVIEAAWETPIAANGVRRRRAPWDDEDEDDDYDYGSNDDGFAAGSSYGWAQDLLKFTLCCNAPIQGACADASMLALLKVDAALREARIEGGPILFVHDEIVLEVRKEDAKEARRILTECMIAGFAEIFPAAPLSDVVSTKVGESWGSAKS